MNVSPRPRVPAALAALAALLLGAGCAAAQERAEPLKRVRALLVIDTNSNLGAAVKIDRDRMLILLKSTMPKANCEIDVLEGDKVTPEGVLAYYRNLKTGPDECLFFYYTGHGGTEKKRGHTLVMGPKFRPLFRSDLLAEMKRKGAGLVVCLTDCCSNVFELRKEAHLPKAAGEPDRIHPVVLDLLFRHRGVVDVTAAEYDTSAYCDDEVGSFMTVALARLINREVKGKEGFLTWREFFPQLKGETEGIFKGWKAKLSPRELEEVKQDNQSPAAFELPGGLAGGAGGYKLGARAELRGDGDGVVILSVTANGPADRLGLEKNDVIKAINDQPIRSLQEYSDLLDRSGGRARLTVVDWRSGKTFHPNVALEPVR